MLQADSSRDEFEGELHTGATVSCVLRGRGRRVDGDVMRGITMPEQAVGPVKG